jgi:hypothetical protein
LLSISGIGILGRELQCSYSTDAWINWPTFQKCRVSSAGLSENFQTQIYSFSGNSSQKTQVTAVEFNSVGKIDFLPGESLKEFPNFNGLIIWDCYLPIIKNELLANGFDSLECLMIAYSEVESIEADAFDRLGKVKYINLWNNKIQSLPFLIFKNNPDLISINFKNNQIDFVNPDLFMDLQKSEHFWFKGNQCINKDLYCTTCPFNQSELDSGFSSCFSNCLEDEDCAVKSGKIGKLNHEKIKF